MNEEITLLLACVVFSLIANVFVDFGYWWKIQKTAFVSFVRKMRDGDESSCIHTCNTYATMK
jgi:hypothetical protein